MSLELANTIATFGTFLVIAATATAAIVQLRHARGSNHIAALNELRESTQAADFCAARHFVLNQLATKLQDPAFRYELATPGAGTDEMQPFIVKANAIGDFYEAMGVLVKTRLVDKDLVLEIYPDQVILAWKKLAPVTAMLRRRIGDALWENFEYLTVLAQDWMAAHPNGNYPTGLRRLDIKDEWLDADKQYASGRSAGGSPIATSNRS